MFTSYTDETDELWNRSNRTYSRLIRSLPVEVAVRYGYEEKPSDRLVERLDHARGQQDWKEVLRFAQELLALGNGSMEGAVGRAPQDPGQHRAVVGAS